MRHKRVDVLQDLDLGHGGADQEVLRHLQAALVKVWARAEHDGDVPSPPKGLHELREEVRAVDLAGLASPKALLALFSQSAFWTRGPDCLESHHDQSNHLLF